MKPAKTSLIEFFRKFYCFMFFRFGPLLGGISPYETQLIERLRTIYYGGLPASILLLIEPLCNGKCYDRATTLSAGLDNFNLVWGSVRSLRLGPFMTKGENIIEQSDHCWVESDGWVYDTSQGLKIKKWLYYLVERPIIRRIKDQDWCRRQKIYKEMLNDNLSQDKYMLPLIMPLIEPHVNKSLYKEYLKQEIATFKDKINYSLICEEINADMILKGFKPINS